MKTEQITASVTDAELEIMQVLWDESPRTAQDIIQCLEAHPSTVKTLINRLLKKGALAFDEKNRKYHYYPTIEKEVFYQAKTQSFLNRFFDGGVTPLVSFFSSRKKLNDREIAELKKLIADLEESPDDE